MLPRQTALTGKFKQSARLQGRAGGRMLLPACASDCKYFSLYVILVGTQPEKERPAFRGFLGVTQLWSEKVLVFITSTQMSTYLPRLSDSTPFPGIVVSVSDTVLHSLTPENRDVSERARACVCARVYWGSLVKDGTQMISVVLCFLSKRVQFNVAVKQSSA